VPINVVVISDRAQKDVRKLPKYIVAKLLSWVESVELEGLENVRKISGYHDEPLKGDRKHQRSIRLNRAYRAIYIILYGEIEFVRIEEVTKHDY